MSLDLDTIMTEDRIVGVLLWSVWHGELPDDLVELVRLIEKDYIVHLRDFDADIHEIIKRVKSFTPDTGDREKLIANLKELIEETIELDTAQYQEGD